MLLIPETETQLEPTGILTASRLPAADLPAAIDTNWEPVAGLEAGFEPEISMRPLSEQNKPAETTDLDLNSITSEPEQKDLLSEPGAEKAVVATWPRKELPSQQPPAPAVPDTETNRAELPELERPESLTETVTVQTASKLESGFDQHFELDSPPTDKNKNKQEPPLAGVKPTIPGQATMRQADEEISLTETNRLFRQVIEQVGRQQGSGRQEITLRLKPPNLGQVRLVLLHRTGTISARFEVENDFVRGALQSNITQLEETLAEQGIQVEELSVYIGQGNAGNDQPAQKQNAFDLHPARSLHADEDTSPGSDYEKSRAVTASGRLDLLI